MKRRETPFLQELFRRIVRLRWWIVALYAALFPLAILLAMQVPTDNSIARLIVRDDPDYLAQEAFRKLFPEGEHVVLLAEAADPLAPEAVQKVDAIEARLAGVPGVKTFSAPALFGRARPGAAAPGDFRRFATGTELLRKQGLVGDDFLGIAVEIEAGRDKSQSLAAIDRAVAQVEASPAPLRALRKIGGPYVDAYLEAETQRASARYFPLFGLFLVAINLTLYRSVRTLAAFLITLAVSVSFTMAFARLAGYASTIVSSLVPLTILITCTAALVYIQSPLRRECPRGTIRRRTRFSRWRTSSWPPARRSSRRRSASRRWPSPRSARFGRWGSGWRPGWPADLDRGRSPSFPRCSEC